ncbi:unnamed protein product [Pleuronectes platessa]|uniref:Uncharacterized protein n=1 Tax=Pleuronectes platessa TaxID=8262 RepID=A0A9N7YG42_PLEPL|nr:unnamed protein product [Pleuronectes platessa]
MYRYVAETVPHLSALHFNLAPKPLVTSTAGTSRRLLHTLNYSEALGLKEVHAADSQPLQCQPLSLARKPGNLILSHQATEMSCRRVRWREGRERCRCHAAPTPPTWRSYEGEEQGAGTREWLFKTSCGSASPYHHSSRCQFSSVFRVHFHRCTASPPGHLPPDAAMSRPIFVLCHYLL